MDKFKIIKSRNYMEMVPMFIEVGLELKPTDPSPESLLVCFEVIEQATGERVGGGALIYTSNEYVLKTVAIKTKYQGLGLGKAVIEYAEKEAKQWNASRLMLNAKIPDFYKKLGYTVVDRVDAPPMSDCLDCHRFHNGCDSEIMKKEFD